MGRHSIPAKILILSPRARSDLDSIYARLKTVSDVATAKRFIAKLNNHIESIARLGHSGVPRNKISPGLRLAVHGNYNIYFRITEFEKILTIIEGAIDVARRNPKPDEPVPSDDYVAWVIVNELRRAGYRIVPTPKS